MGRCIRVLFGNISQRPTNLISFFFLNPLARTLIPWVRIVCVAAPRRTYFPRFPIHTA